MQFLSQCCPGSLFSKRSPLLSASGPFYEISQKKKNSVLDSHRIMIWALKIIKEFDVGPWYIPQNI